MLKNPPEECQAIVRYWQSYSGDDDVPLTAQFNDWRRFRAYQQRMRHRHRVNFEAFEHQLRQRRQRHGLDDDVRLTQELDQQSRLERWIEFQDYQLLRLEEFERERDKVKMDLIEASSAFDESALTRNLEGCERKIQRHRILLHWIEEQRQLMHRGDNATLATDRANTNVQERALRSHVHLRKNAQRPAAAEHLDVVPQQTAILEKLRPRNADQATRIKHSKVNPLLRQQVGPQKVTKRRPRSRGPALASQPQIVTRSGRISKPPNRWVPG
jgi:hypothetical protein